MWEAGFERVGRDSKEELPTCMGRKRKMLGVGVPLLTAYSEMS